MLRKLFSGALMTLLVGATSANAEPSASRVQIRNRSAAAAFGTTRLQIVSRKAGPGNAAGGSAIVGALATRLGVRAGNGDYATKQDKESLWFQGSDWSMKVSDQGNYTHFRRAGSTSEIPVSMKPSSSKIEASGRAFISQILSGFVALRSNEQLVYLGSKFGYTHSQTIGAPPEPPMLSDWAAFFGRTLDGQLVVGGGSTVAVFFNADDSIQGFDLDWPQYEASGVFVDTLDIASVRNRAEAFAGSTKAGEVRTEVALECGLMDLGGRKRRRSEVVQPACIQFVKVVKNGANSGATWAVPAARTPVRGSNWPELAVHCTASGACRESIQ